MLLLAAHARDVTTKLFEGLKSFNNLDSMSSDIDEYVRYAVSYFQSISCFPEDDYRKLASIAMFSKEKAEKRAWKRVITKQSDADDIKKWEKELTRAFELFNVRKSLLFISRPALTSSTDRRYDRHQS
jgi:hypothetical protein